MEFETKRIFELTQILDKHYHGNHSDVNILSLFFNPELIPELRILWLKYNWSISLYASFLYVFVVYIGQTAMKGRKAFDLRTVMAGWNFGLSLFSIITCYVTIPEYLDNYSKYGFHRLTCGPMLSVSKTAYYCGWLFTLAKMFELGDTAFLILRKRPVILLHWYHHATVLIFSWYAFAAEIPLSGSFAIINAIVHSFMYAYFGLTAIGMKIPKIIAKSITIVQLSQMVIGILLSMYVVTMSISGSSCEVPSQFLQYGFIIYASYFVLFAKFFHDSYYGGKDKKIKSKTN